MGVTAVARTVPGVVVGMVVPAVVGIVGWGAGIRWVLVALEEEEAIIGSPLDKALCRLNSVARSHHRGGYDSLADGHCPQIEGAAASQLSSVRAMPANCAGVAGAGSTTATLTVPANSVLAASPPPRVRTIRGASGEEGLGGVPHRPLHSPAPVAMPDVTSTRTVMSLPGPNTDRGTVISVSWVRREQPRQVPTRSRHCGYDLVQRASMSRFSRAGSPAGRTRAS